MNVGVNGSTAIMSLRLQKRANTIYSPQITLTSETSVSISGTSYKLPAGAEIELLHRRPLGGAIVVVVIDDVAYRVLWQERDSVDMVVDPSAVTTTWVHAEPLNTYLLSLPAKYTASV
jgi:hypothetical protein